MLDLATVHRRARRVLPARIDTSRVVLATAGPARLAALLLPLGHRHRGTVLFELSPSTRQALDARALMFLQDACVAREGLGRHGLPLAYEAWRPMHSGEAVGFITRSRDGRACLQLDPAQGLALYAWDDHRGGRITH
ncbi:hypothetical protein J2X02_001891 [Pseudoxanthomonas japonensis]|uniref:hypothetical protein n=1 Tax=Pseudoxanthomonas japonensis TaxID=69284 RepID=UPI00286178CA|nr:hypothetical protein [Pseudoxanthomonas japonensis]MDR7069040.1 hypothetical protein [Pseudoxanthomonas japonensis]